MNQNKPNRPAEHFKRIVRAEVTPGEREMVVSYADNNNGLTLASFGVSPLSGKTLFPLKGATRFELSALPMMHKMFTWILVRLQKEDVEENQYEYVQALQDGFLGSQDEKEFEQHMFAIGFPPTRFRGGSYENFQQNEERIREY
jgi:hypothetical protein